MSLVLTSAIVAGSILAGRMVARLVRRARGESSTEPQEEREKRETGEAKETTAVPAVVERHTEEDPFTRFPCRLGDVILALGTDEAWLAGALLLCEEVPAAALFIAPDAGGDRAVLARPRPSEEILWLRPTDASRLGLAAEPPSSIEHEGERFERLRRLPYRAERHGAGAPDLGDAVIFAEYTSPSGDVLVILTSRGASRAWSGRALSAGMYEVLASGQHAT